MRTETPAYATGVSLDAARALIVAHAAARPLPSESIALQDALGRVLAHSVSAPFDVPGFANSAMDGFALRGVDLPLGATRAFALIGEIFAGGSAAPTIAMGQCVRITTGAPLPSGADTVVIKENVRVDGNAVWVEPGERLHANTRPAGEDYRQGELALHAGKRLGAADLGVLASFGLERIEVIRRVRAVLLTTGDELRPPGVALGYGQIHDSNRFSLGGLLQAAGVDLVRHRHLRDDPPALRAALLEAASDADIVLSSGGVSAGEADYLPGLLAELGRVLLWKVQIKPGMPFLFGEIGTALVFSLPGNPVSGVATFLALVRPALAAMSALQPGSARWYARLSAPLQKRHNRTELVRAGLGCDASGGLWATPLTKQGSGMLRGVAEADVLLLVPEQARKLAAGAVLEFLPLPGAFG